MKRTRLLISISLISMLLVYSSAFAALKFNPKKPFAGKFEGSIQIQGYPVDIVYTLKMNGSNITGKGESFMNGQPVLTVNASGTVDKSGKFVDITIPGASQAGSPSDFVRITLLGNGRNGVKMQYLDAIGGTPFGDVVKYKRSK